MEKLKADFKSIISELDLIDKKIKDNTVRLFKITKTVKRLELKRQEIAEMKTLLKKLK